MVGRKTRLENVLRRIYFSTKHVGSYGGVNALRRVASAVERGETLAVGARHVHPSQTREMSFPTTSGCRGWNQSAMAGRSS